MERNIGPDQPVNIGISNFSSQGITVIKIIWSEVPLELGRVDGLIQTCQANYVKTIREATYAYCGLRRTLLGGRERPLHQNEHHARKHYGDGKQQTFAQRRHLPFTVKFAVIVKTAEVHPQELYVSIRYISDVPFVESWRFPILTW